MLIAWGSVSMTRWLLLLTLHAHLIGCQDERILGAARQCASGMPRLPAQDAGVGCPGSLGGGTFDGASEADGSRVPAKHTILISADGLGAGYLDWMLRENRLPNIGALRQWGASTTHARTDFEYTDTLPNHTSMLTGRPVLPIEGFPPDVNHGYIYDVMPSPDQTLHNSGNPNLSYVASMFDVAHDSGLRTCMYAGKAKFILHAQSYSATAGAPDTIGADHGRNKIDRCAIIEGNTPALVAMATADMAGGLCDLVFFHIADLDLLGQELGWGTADWLQMLDTVDAWLGSLAQAAEPHTTEPWGLVFTADHGGEGDTHYDPTLLDDYRVPFFVVGPGIPANADLYQVSGGRRTDPGLGRPDYAAADQPVRNGDAGNVALSLLGSPPIPGSLMRELLP
jgi:hypothetical protein